MSEIGRPNESKPVVPSPVASRAWMSAAIPGLGQFVQGRPVAGTIQFLAVATHLVTALTLSGVKPALFAMLWNAWSCFDAWRHDRTD